jgi:hypothetical protein
MNDTQSKSPTSLPEPAGYTKELPATPEERERAVPEFISDVEAKEQGTDPQPSAAPYDAERFNGTNDSSRFSTPPPKKSSSTPS